MNKKREGFCYRCEHRAGFKETGHGGRCECEGDSCYCGCYRYKPVAPCIMVPRKGDNRSIFLPDMLAGRSDFGGVVEDIHYQPIQYGEGYALFVVPKGYVLKKEDEE